MRSARLVLLAGLLLAPAAVGREGSAPEELRALVARSGPAAGEFGVHVVDAKTGETLFEVAPDTPRVPASAMKLVTTAAALRVLGHDYRFRTRALAAKRPGPDGVLAGDLVVEGGGDPLLTAEDGDAPLEVLARRVARSGVRRVGGDLVLDDGRFDRELRHPSWPRKQWQESYSAAVSALSVAKGCVTVTVLPGKSPGSHARVSLTPSTGVLSVGNEIVTTASKKEHFIRFDLLPDRGAIRCRGKIWIRSTGFSDEVAVDRPTLFFGDVFQRALVRAGVAVAGDVVRRAGAAGEIAEPVVLGTWETGILDVLEATNKPSENQLAECVLKTLGAEATGEGSFAAGAAAAARFAEKAGVRPEELRQADGSGLSHEDRVSPRALTAILAHVYGTEDRIAFMQTLATGGGADGTLRKRLADLGSDVRAKTGTLSGVSALAGYLKASGGRVLCFAVLVNDPKSRARAFQDEVCRILHRRY